MLQIAVNTAITHQPHQMQRVTRACRPEGGEQHLIFKEAAIIDQRLDIGLLLHHHPPGTQIHMADLAVTDLPGGQADGQARGGQFRVWVTRPNLVEGRRFRQRHRIAGAGRCDAPSIQYDQCYRSHRTTPSFLHDFWIDSSYHGGGK